MWRWRRSELLLLGFLPLALVHPFIVLLALILGVLALHVILRILALVVLALIFLLGILDRFLLFLPEVPVHGSEALSLGPVLHHLVRGALVML